MNDSETFQNGTSSNEGHFRSGNFQEVFGNIIAGKSQFTFLFTQNIFIEQYLEIIFPRTGNPWNSWNKAKITSAFHRRHDEFSRKTIFVFLGFLWSFASNILFLSLLHETFFFLRRNRSEKKGTNWIWNGPLMMLSGWRKGFIRTQLSSSFSRRMWNAQHVTLKLTRIVGIIAIIKGLWCLVVFFRLSGRFIIKIGYFSGSWFYGGRQTHEKS